MGKGLSIAAPPPRPSAAAAEPAGAVAPTPAVSPAPVAKPAPAARQPRAKRPAPAGERFGQVRDGDMVQLNRRVPQHVADGYEMLAIRMRCKVPDLIAEGLELLQEKYGKV